MASSATPPIAPPPPSMRILTIGPPNGSIPTLIQKVTAIHNKHGPFHALFVLGDFFAGDGGDALTHDEDALLAGSEQQQLRLPVRTYISQGVRRLPTKVNEIIAAGEAGEGGEGQRDYMPVKIAHNLYWLGKDRVNWVTKEGEYGVQGADADYDYNYTHAGQDGLRVAVCGGKWDKVRWAQEIQGQRGEKDDVADLDAAQHAADDAAAEQPYILPSSLEKLYRHPAFKPSTPHTSTISTSAGNGGGGGEPTTLAAARAQLQAEQAAAAASPASPTPPPPTIDVLLLPTWPAGITLFSKNFPPAGAPEQARTWGLPPIAEVLRRGRPRYAFAPTPSEHTGLQVGAVADGQDDPLRNARENGVFWEREPYLNLSAPASQPAQQQQRGNGVASSANAVAISRGTATMLPPPRITRFASLAHFSNPAKVRWFLALNLPVAAGQQQAAAAAVKGATKSPFGDFYHIRVPAGGGQKRKAGQEDADTASADGDDEGLASAVNFRWTQSQGRGGGGGGGKRQRQGQSGQRNGDRDDGPPPEGYVCKVCGSREHYVRLCPHRESRPLDVPGGMAASYRPPGAEDALGPRFSRRGQGQEPVQMVGPKDCWFCLSNASCAKHLVVAIGVEAYLALPRGQLPPASDAACPVPGGGHVLLVPISHAPSLPSLGDAAARARLADEMEAYLAALARCYSAFGCVLVAWSVVRLSNTRAGHMQVQCVPVPQQRIMAAERERTGQDEGGIVGREVGGGGGPEVETRGPVPVATFLQAQAINRGYDLDEVTDAARQRLGGGAREGEEYFQVDVLSLEEAGDGDGDAQVQRRTLRMDLSPVSAPASSSSSSSSAPASSAASHPSLPVRPGAPAAPHAPAHAHAHAHARRPRFDLQFPRQALAAYLGVPQRADWRACVSASEKVEEAETRVFRDVFRGWMPRFGDGDEDEDEEDEEGDSEEEGE